MLSIHDLPVELLVHVFRCVSPTRRIDIRLSHVCSLWRDTLNIRTPEFWGELLLLPDLITQNDQERSIGFWYSFVNRTLSQPLRLQLRGVDFDLLGTISNHLPRLTSLRVQWKTTRYPKDVGRRLLAIGPLPALERLQLVSDRPTPGAIFLDHNATGHTNTGPSVDKYPRLRYLEINLDFFIPAMVVPSLRTLFIHPGHMSLATLLTTLAQCAALEVLHIADVKFWHQDLDTLSRVYLSHLHELRLDYASSSHSGVLHVHHLLQYIRYPLTSRLVISSSSDNMLGLFPEPELEPLSHAFTQLVVRGFDGIDHRGAPRTYTVSVEGYVDCDREDKPRLQVVNQDTLWQHPEAPIIHSISRYFCSSATKELQICLLDRQLKMPPTDWTDLFVALPALTSLVVRIWSCTGLLKALGQTPLQLVGLESLTLTCRNASGIPRDLVSALELRVSMGHRLQRLEFNCSHARFSSLELAQLQDAVAEVVIVDNGL